MILVITNMGPIKYIKGVQWVMGCLPALSHFISCLSEKGIPLYSGAKPESEDRGGRLSL
jgi:hypothetical protein